MQQHLHSASPLPPSLSNMDRNAQQLQMFVLTLMAHGHMLPAVDMSISFAKLGALVTIITTPSNAALIHQTIHRAVSAGLHLKLHLLPFPSAQAGLPHGFEHADQITSPDTFTNFIKALDLLQQPVENLIEHHRPNCLFSDVYLPWAVETAHKFGISSLVFSGHSCFALSACLSVARYKPHQHVESETEPFVLPGLPHPIKMTSLQIPDFMRVRDFSSEIWERAREAERRSNGILANSFFELEGEYVGFLEQEVGTKVWPIGPVCLCNQEILDKVDRGKKAAIDEDECLRWLDSMNLGSVVFVSFGSACSHRSSQLLEIASALEMSGHPFIWVVRNHELLSNEPWLPDGFEERMEGKGLIIRGWAPQILILNHPSLGAFLTHCGWNSVTEGITAGLPMITWPAFAEQFFNEKLITDVLKIGVGVAEWVGLAQDSRPLVRRKEIGRAVKLVMEGGEEAEEMRKRVRKLREMAKSDVQEGGSSYLAMTGLIEELRRIFGLQ